MCRDDDSSVGRRSIASWLPAFLLTVAEIAGSHAVAADRQLPPAVERRIDFRRDVAPILQKHCFACHAGRDAEAGVRLDSREEILGLTSGRPLARTGRSADSRLIQLAGGLDPQLPMPPAGEGEPLTTEQLAVLRAWIDQGLSWDGAFRPGDATTDHWAFQPMRRPSLPKVRDQEWVRTPVDAFIAAQHERRDLSPSPRDSRRTLIRRVTLDLTGLPPAPEAIERFLADDSPAAYEILVDGLLASPHYGERWGRHWLDVARWAESEGYESNHLRPYAWRYRDYVIGSFNQDRPYDEFLRQQIAGDLIEPYSDENLVATGFLASARLSSNEEDKLLQRNDVLVDIVNATASATLGLTLECAQCHNHKFDPLTQLDYYAFQGFFVRGQVNNLVLRDPQLWREYRARLPEGYEAAVSLRDAIFADAREKTLAEVRSKLTAEMITALETPSEQRTELQRELARQADLQFQFTPLGFERRIPAEDRRLYDELQKKIARMEASAKIDKPQTWGFYSPAGPHQLDILPMKGFYPLPYDVPQLREAAAQLLVRGDVHRPAFAVPAAWPAVFASGTPPADGEASRLMLAAWLADKGNPLTARVWVNRIWQYHFGRGIVTTSGDFGVAGASPTHPELLDYLATELIDHDWSTKHIHRIILLSATYQQSSAWDEKRAAVDPQNQFWWRRAPRRLESEVIRDSLLLISGELDQRVGGPSDDNEASPRRGLYLLTKRDEMPEMQRLFDGPGADESCARRHTSTVALQPLYLLNSPFVVERARTFAQRLLRQAGDDVERQISVAFLSALGRPPDELERASAAEFLQAAGDQSQSKLVQLCHSLLNLNEFIYVD